jgi:hypothetical protein
MNKRKLYTRKNLTTCQQDVFAKQACQQVVIMLLFYQVATRLSLMTTCWQTIELQDDITSFWNNLWEFCWAQKPCSKLSTCRWQLVNKLGTGSANTSCWQVVGTALLQSLLQFFTTRGFFRLFLPPYFPLIITQPFLDPSPQSRRA